MGKTLNPAIDCGIDPNDSLLVAYLPKLDSVLQEFCALGGNGEEYTAHSIDGILLDVTSTKPVRWWKVRMVADDLGLALPDVVWRGRAGDFSSAALTEKLYQVFGDHFQAPDEHKLYMRAYSRGPWICIEDEQLNAVYGKESQNESASE